MALAAINNEEVAGKSARELSDDEVLKVLAREERKEAAEAFEGAGRAEQAASELAETAVLVSRQAISRWRRGLSTRAVARSEAAG